MPTVIFVYVHSRVISQFKELHEAGINLLFFFLFKIVVFQPANKFNEEGFVKKLCPDILFKSMFAHSFMVLRSHKIL